MPNLLLDIKVVKTGFLVSSSPRCSAKGFGWAPQTPRLRTIKGFTNPIRPDYYESHYPVKIYHSYDGKGSVQGKVTVAGLEASWLTLMLRTEDDLKALAPWDENFGHETWEHVITLFRTYQSVALLRVLAEDRQGPWRASDQQGQESGSKVVVCASNDTKYSQWTGVFEAPWGIEPGGLGGELEYKAEKYKWQTMDLLIE